LRLRPGNPLEHRWARVAYAIATTVAACLLVASLVSPLVSAYQIGLAMATTLGNLLLLCWSGAWRLGREGRQALVRLTGRPRMLDAMLAICLTFACFAAMTRYNLARYNGNYSGMILLSRVWAERAPVLVEQPEIARTLVVRDKDNGYDGQFMYLIAFDPLLLRFKDQPARYADMVDAPRYRYGRVGFSLLTALLSWNQPLAYPRTMIWLILASHLLAVGMLAAIAVHYGRHPAWALLYLAIPGPWMSLRTALPEPLAGVGLLVGYLLWARSRLSLAAVAFALSLLIRETGVVLVVCLLAWSLLVDRRPQRALILSASLVPLVAWRAYVAWRLSPIVGEGTFAGARILDVPFKGILDVWRSVMSGAYFDRTPESGRAALALTLLVGAVTILAVVTAWKRRDALSGALAAYALLAVCLDFESVWSYLGNIERTTYEVWLLGVVAFLVPGASPLGLRRAFMAMFGSAALYTLFLSDSARDLQALF
jgi:hypothetical protein